MTVLDMLGPLVFTSGITPTVYTSTEAPTFDLQQFVIGIIQVGLIIAVVIIVITLLLKVLKWYKEFVSVI